MDFEIDNYYISLSFGGSMIISIGGQNIIFDRYDPVLNSFEGAYIFAIDAIKKYNDCHGLAWGEVETIRHDNQF